LEFFGLEDSGDEFGGKDSGETSEDDAIAQSVFELDYRRDFLA
jgi:hypothetical protein